MGVTGQGGQVAPFDYAGYAGYVIVGLFIVSWIGAVAIWKYGRIEERWSAQLRSDHPAGNPSAPESP